MQWQYNVDSAYWVPEFGGYPDCYFTAIYRAHGSAGIRIRELIANVFPRIILQFPNWKKSVTKAIRHAALKVDEQLIDTLEATYSGVVATVCLVVGKIVTIAQIGDNIVYSLDLHAGDGDTVDYKGKVLVDKTVCSMPEEKKRIEAAGGVV